MWVYFDFASERSLGRTRIRQKLRIRSVAAYEAPRQDYAKIEDQKEARKRPERRSTRLFCAGYHWAASLAMSIILLALAVLVWGVVSLICPLYRNWTTARQLHVRLIICPIPKDGILWQLARLLLQRYPLHSLWKYLPVLRMIRPNWIFLEQHAIYQDFGEVFAFVTPTRCEVFVANVDIATQILSRRHDFPKPIEMLQKLNLFGKSLASVEGADWNHHRRCTAAAFSDKVNETVWTQSYHEASRTLEQFLSRDVVSQTRSEMIRISFAVLLNACMGIGDNDETDAIEKRSFDLDAAKIDLTTLLRIISRSPALRFSLPFGRKGPNAFTAARVGFQSFLMKLITYRRDQPPGHKDLLSSMIRYQDENMLSDEELQGNMFLFMFAGHETTANTLIYIIHLLAVFPNWQSWAMEEIDEVIGGRAVDRIPSSQETFPRLRRLRAIVYETLRLYGPVVMVPRQTSPHQPQKVTRPDGSELVIPPNIRINIVPAAWHTSQEYWGADASSWNPSRWICQDTSSSPVPPESNHEILDRGKIDNLLAWAMGPRSCPGKRFSQLEIMAVLVALLQHAAVQVSPVQGTVCKRPGGKLLG
ncbi:cytochrome P450 monooxygenase [Penicillium hispanicum]|uniref:cytochrome P450 monooxygenase n=1 Tax=Penicillium hispanicum TaxID=1080232 RepID=UPI00254193FE|nr:cytochrome P450 monooxygenase [Penicillium hispanicum]KAJ5584880.1 cytochrome P450 monooxygenase [Penicillium hispanicum]